MCAYCIIVTFFGKHRYEYQIIIHYLTHMFIELAIPLTTMTNKMCTWFRSGMRPEVYYNWAEIKCTIFQPTTHVLPKWIGIIH